MNVHETKVCVSDSSNNGRYDSLTLNITLFIVECLS